MKKITVILLLSLICCCCNRKFDEKQLEINRNDFPVSIKLTGGEEIYLDSTLIPLTLNVLRDTIVLAENRGAYPFYFSMYNIRTGKKIIEFARRGRGPNEFLSGKCNSNNYNCSNLNHIYIYDGVRKRVSEYNIDSLIQKQEQYEPKQIDVPDCVFYFSKLDSNHYVCFNSYFLNDKKFKNNVEKIFIYDLSEEKPDKFDWKYFTLNVSKGYVLIAPDNDRIIVPHHYEDKIDIYNKNLVLLKTLVGPDMIIPEYRLRGDNHISFKIRTRYRGYYPCCYTNNSIYLIYLGLNGIDNNIDYRKPVEVFKLDWNGNLIKRYVLDRYIFRISVSSDEKYLYGASLNSIGEPILVRYTINQL